MSTEVITQIALEIAHVLFIDIVGYSKLLIDEQRDYLHTLNEVVRETDAFRAAEAAGKLTRLPTGDGMALVFATTPDAPVSCALQVSKALRSHPELRVRMGIHSGPVSGITDVNDRSNVAGAGINLAQRVMDCGDAGHILLSKHVADDLEQYRQWRSHLHDLGECAVKHDVRLHVVNLYTDELGNEAVPEKFRQAKKARLLSFERRRVEAGLLQSRLFLLLRLLSVASFCRGVLRPSRLALARCQHHPLRAHATRKRRLRRQWRPTIFRYYRGVDRREGACLAAAGNWTTCSCRFARAELRRPKTAALLGSAPRRSAL